MGYHSVGVRVAARPAHLAAAAPPLRSAAPPAPSRQDLRLLGAELVAILQEEIDACAHVDRIPEPQQMFKDMGRGRAMSAVQYAAALVALARAPGLPTDRLRRVFVRVWAVLQAQRPAPDTLCLSSAFEAESDAQARADKAQAFALSARLRRDPVALRRAIDETAAEIASKGALLTTLQRELRLLTSARAGVPA